MRQYNTIYVLTICDKNTIDIRTVYEQNDHEYVIRFEYLGSPMCTIEHMVNVRGEIGLDHRRRNFHKTAEQCIYLFILFNVHS